eukprot:PLAT6653.1.p1 GENE.PLAT6653.1~~PLAT6653.1.p1  ORF type:complete len:473 (+),score=173.28 PLAT6653.1:258-1676(+)
MRIGLVSCTEQIRRLESDLCGPRAKHALNEDEVQLTLRTARSLLESKALLMLAAKADSRAALEERLEDFKRRSTVEDDELAGYLQEFARMASDEGVTHRPSMLASARAVKAAVEENPVYHVALSVALSLPEHAAVKAMAEDVFSWQFDVFKLSETTHGKPLLFAMAIIFHKLRSLRTSLALDMESLLGFARQLQAGYRAENAYHNSMHGADVLCAFAAFLHAGLAAHVSELDAFAGLLAAAAHDFKHDGVNNSFHVQTQSPLALTYNDRSVLENMHVSEAFRAMRCDGADALRGLPDDQRRSVRSTMIQMVLATDMSQHFGVLEDFSARVHHGLCADAALPPASRPVDTTVRPLLLSIALHCADISNAAKDKRLYLRWTELVMQEFFAQGDREKELRLQVSPFCDRVKSSVSKCQIGFLRFIVMPLFEQWGKYLPALQPQFSSNLQRNLEEWESAPEAKKRHTIRVGESTAS